MPTTTPTVDQAHAALIAAQQRERIAREGYRLATQAEQTALSHRRFETAHAQLHAEAQARQATAQQRDELRAAQQAVSEAQATLRRAAQTAVHRARDQHQPAYRDAVQGVCHAIDALDAALAYASQVSNAYQQAAPPEPVRQGRSLPPLGPLLPNIDRLLAWRDDHR